MLTLQCNWVVDDNAPPVLGSTNNRSQSTSNTSTAKRPVKVSYLTEQTSHHPPVSAFWIDCPEKGISACGFDQLSAKFTGTSVRVTPGAYNLGIFITLHRWNNETYQMTHPTAQLGGFLRGESSPERWGFADSNQATSTSMLRIHVISHAHKRG